MEIVQLGLRGVTIIKRWLPVTTLARRQATVYYIQLRVY